MMALESDVIDPETGQAILTQSVIFEHELDFATDADIRDTIARLAAKKLELTAPLFKKWETAVGFNFEPHGLLFDELLAPVIKPCSHYCLSEWITPDCDVLVDPCTENNKVPLWQNTPPSLHLCVTVCVAC